MFSRTPWDKHYFFLHKRISLLLCEEFAGTKKVKWTMICNKVQLTAIYREKELAMKLLAPGPGYKEEPVTLSKEEIQTGQILNLIQAHALSKQKIKWFRTWCQVNYLASNLIKLNKKNPAIMNGDLTHFKQSH